MRWQLPPLNPLKAFEAAARHGSITEAAEELNVTQAAVSRQIRTLELMLKQKLFLRLHRQIRLTTAGEEYFGVVTHLFSELDAATRAVLSHRERVRIRFMGYHTFNLRWLIPRLAEFYAQYPHIEIDIAASVGPIDFTRHDVDCAIRTGRGEWEDCEYHFVAPIEFRPVCRPLGPADPPLATVDDLARHTLIKSLTRGEVWGRWLKAVGHSDLQPMAWLTFDHGGYCYQAAVEGVGVALGEDVFVKSDIKAGRLYYPFATAYCDTNSYYFLQPRHVDKPGVREFGSWIAARAAAA
ncbi:MAG TPA: LysR substrate-binding domain-containing protein [Devosiaceae bacterium]|jgi:LysR family glycine cleavage system transcriptional activator